MLFIKILRGLKEEDDDDVKDFVVTIRDDDVVA